MSEVKVTLITADANRLACAHEQAFDGVHCEFKTDRDRWPKARDEPLDDNKEKVIQPYRTAPGNNLVLLSGLWAHHEVAMRLHREPPAGVPIKQLARFVATCQVKWLGKLDKVRTRWMAGGRWQDDGTAMVGRTESCTVNAM